MSSEPLSWDDLRCIDALARAGSVSAAARELGVSVSTLYRRIGALEEATGFRCLTRRSGVTELTDAGRALAAVGLDTRAAIQRVVGEVRSRETGLVGEVSLTTVEGMLPFLGPPLAALAQAHPQLTVKLHLGDTGPSVRRREVDVAIGVMTRPSAECWGRRLFRIRYGVFGTEAAASAEPPRWVVQGPALAHTPEGRWESEHADRVALSTASRAGTVALVRAGVGIGLLPRSLAALHPELVELRRYRPQTESLERVAWVLTHESARRTPRVRALVGVLVEHLSRLGR